MLAFTIPLVDFEVPIELVAIGAITGITYGLFAMGLTLTYQASRALNFSQGAMGALPHFLVASLVIDNGFNYWVALVIALVAGAAAGALIDATVIRRMANAPRLVVLVATVAAAQILAVPIQLILLGAGTGAGDASGGSKLSRSSYPTPFEASFEIGSLTLSAGHLMILVVSPLLLAGLTWFLRKTTIGVASRASAENREAAQLSGVPVHRVSLVVWTLAGLLAASAAILAGPTRPILTAGLGLAGGGGGDLLLRGLGAAMLGGLVSLPQVFVAGIVLGLFEALTLWNYPTGGVVELVMGGAVVAGLLFRRDLRQLARGTEESSWALAASVRALPERVAKLPRVRAARSGALAVAAAIALVLPIPAGPPQRILYSAILLYIIIGLSLVLLTGWGGQVSFGQFAFVAIGAIVGGRMNQLGYPVWSALVISVAAGAVVAAVVGIPALRVRGLFLAVTTLAFAVVANAWLFRQPWLVHVEGAESSLRLDRPDWAGIDFQNELVYYYFCLLLVVASIALVQRLRRTGLGRTILAMRDNEPMAMSLGLSPSTVKLTTFVISGMLASFAGFFYGMLIVNYGGTAALGSPANSLSLVTLVIFGGSNLITGAVLGALYVRGLPYFIEADWAILLSSGLGLLVVLLISPGGLAALFFRVRDRVLRAIVKPEDLAALDAETTSTTSSAFDVGELLAPASPGSRIAYSSENRPIEAHDVVVQYGGIRALGGVSVYAEAGEIIGLIGPNGAGKTTLFDVLSGHVAPTSGRVMLHGFDVTSLAPADRARFGIARSFQQARLFDELRVVDVFQLALERTDPTEVLPALFALPPSRRSEAQKRARAEELVSLLRLEEVREQRCADLSTGTRRIVELGCLIASGSDVLLLDEPTGGLSQRETEEFTPLLRQIRDHLDATMVIVAHDVPLITGIADRIYVLSSGQLLAHGTPEEIIENPLVVAAYLGTDSPDEVVEEAEHSAATATVFTGSTS